VVFFIQPAKAARELPADFAATPSATACNDRKVRMLRARAPVNRWVEHMRRFPDSAAKSHHCGGIEVIFSCGHTANDSAKLRAGLMTSCLEFAEGRPVNFSQSLDSASQKNACNAIESR